jgi:hypothetical protein
MKFAKPFASWGRACRAMETVKPYSCHWNAKTGVTIGIKTNEDRIAVLELTDEELDKLIAEREAVRAKAKQYTEQGHDVCLTLFGFNL